jgi:hypothetical protein
VAMARFHYPRELAATERATPEIDYYGPLPEGSNIELSKVFFEQLEHYEDKYVDRENSYGTSLLSALPLMY